MVGLAMVGGFGLMLAAAGGAASPTIRETVLEAPAGATKRLVRIPARGLLLEGGGPMGEGPGITRPLLDMLSQAERDPRVEGVLLELDTPGGSVTDSDLLHERVKALRGKGKRVHVLMGDLCASGGVYVAVAAERIQALPTAVTGSVGVVISAVNFSGLMERHGVQDTSVVSGPNKALLSPTRPVDPEHQRILQGIVDAMYARFVKLVAEGRGLAVERVQAFADGRLLTADQALAFGLIDAVGYADAALDALREAAGGGPYEVVRYEVEPTLIDLLKARAAAPEPRSVLGSLARPPRAMYVFAPALP
jgi:protease-4